MVVEWMYIHGMLPSMVENMFIMFIQKSDVQNYPTRQADLLYVQFPAMKRTQGTIAHDGKYMEYYLQCYK